jgi:cbb3-type cytochrome oxidase subunit 3
MDMNDIRIAVTLASLALFAALVWHTFSRSRSHEHDDAAVLPFTGDAPHGERT